MRVSCGFAHIKLGSFISKIIDNVLHLHNYKEDMQGIVEKFAAHAF